MNLDLECGTCSPPNAPPQYKVMMHRVGQFQVRNVPGDVFAFHCTKCNGKAHMQLAKDPRTGQTIWRQIRLQGTHDEYRPNVIDPREQIEIVPAYTLGSSPATARRRSAEPLMAPEPAYTLGAGQAARPLPPNHPMHPNQIRSRIQPAYRLQ